MKFKNKSKSFDPTSLGSHSYTTSTNTLQPRIENHDFVKAWLSSDTVAQVAKKLNISPASASAKANYLRNKGVNLPNMERPKPDPNSVEELNKLVAKYQKRAQ
jgi:hypothetical protein